MTTTHNTKITINTVTSTAMTMCVLGAAFYYYEYYLRVAPSVMSAELKQTFLLGEAAFGHLAACYYYAYTPLQIPVGMMMDRFGPRRILTLACFLCAMGTYLFASTTILLIAQLGRFLVGFGSAFAYVGVLKISNLWLPKKYFALMAGLCTALGMLGGISGQIAMSYWVGSIGWQSTLNYAAFVGLILTAVLWIMLRDKPKQLTVTDTERSYDSTQNKLANLKAITFSSQIWLNGLIGCLTYLPITVFAEVWAVNFLQTAGLSKQQAAVGSSLLFLGFAVGGPIWGIVSDRIQSRRIPLIIGSFGAAIFMAGVIFMPTLALIWLYLLLFLSAFFAGAEILIFAVSNDISRPSASATAIAFSNMFTMIGGMVLPWVVGMMLDKNIQIVDNVPIIQIQDYSMTLIVLPLGLVLSGILSMVLKESYQKTPKVSTQ